MIEYESACYNRPCLRSSFMNTSTRWFLPREENCFRFKLLIFNILNNYSHIHFTTLAVAGVSPPG